VRSSGDAATRRRGGAATARNSFVHHSRFPRLSLCKPMNDPASEWMEAARRGDPDAAARLVDGFHARIYAFLRRLAGSDTNAVELTQRTFCRAWESLAGFAGRSSVSSWLHGIESCGPRSGN
jgi:hypothetical protein